MNVLLSLNLRFTNVTLILLSLNLKNIKTFCQLHIFETGIQNLPLKLKIPIIFPFQISKLPDKTNNLLVLFFVKLHLVEFSLNLGKRLYKSVSNSLPQCNIKGIFQSKNRLCSFFKFKFSIPLHLRPHLIYKFQCSNCNINYYSETERHLKVRACEHTGRLH